MATPLSHFHSNLALLTDLYQLTMAYGYFRLKRDNREAVFHLSFRKAPFNGGFTIACGLEAAIDFFRRFSFSNEDLAYLATLQGADEKPLFDGPFLKYLRDLRLTVDIDAIPEGTVVFAHEPLVRVRGPLLQCQLLETALLNAINFPTLVATKAARICLATNGDPVLEFGLRRAQGIDGAISASRAAFVGGCAATSNVLAGRLFDIPVRGTHAHSWVMAFDDELTAFDAYASSLPNNCVFLVDTYDTLEGVRHAVQIGRRLKRNGQRLLGIRLDSGDLAYLSIEAREILDRAGFQETAILATNDLDEHIIRSLKTQGATIGVWGVGTRLVTAYDQPALGGVFKLSALRKGRPSKSAHGNSEWEYKIKLSEQLAKTSIPGMLQVRRFLIGGEARGDMIFDELSPPLGRKKSVIVDPMDPTRRKAIPATARSQDLLVPIFRGGKLVYDLPRLTAIRERSFGQLAAFHPTIKRAIHPHEYPVGLEQSLSELRQQAILTARQI